MDDVEGFGWSIFDGFGCCDVDGFGGLAFCDFFFFVPEFALAETNELLTK